MATNARTKIEIGWTFEKDDTIATTKQEANIGTDSELSYANGTAANQINNLHVSRRTLTSASGTEDIDLQVLKNPAGDTINFQQIKFIYIKNREPTGGTDLQVGGAGTNAWIAPWKDAPTPTTVKTTVEAGGEWFLSSPIDGMRVITAERILRVTHAGGSSGDLDFDFIVIGD